MSLFKSASQFGTRRTIAPRTTRSSKLGRVTAKPRRPKANNRPSMGRITRKQRLF